MEFWYSANMSVDAARVYALSVFAPEGVTDTLSIIFVRVKDGVEENMYVHSTSARSRLRSFSHRRCVRKLHTALAIPGRAAFMREISCFI
jgi:hypothetical protein